MNSSQLYQALKTESTFRIKQVKQTIFKDFVGTWNENSTLPKTLREKLNQVCPLEISAELFEDQNRRTIKTLIKLEDDLEIETVLMRHRDGRATVCVSSQIGCPLACEFCATGALGFKRNLSADEIIDQVLFFARYLKKYFPEEHITNVVFMGMGEPLLNYDNVLKSIRILNDPEDFGLGARRISLSTIGVIENIKKLAQEKIQINLAISLHAASDQLRSQLMPINKKYPLEKVLTAVDNYIEKTGRQVMFAYLLIDKINDSEQDAKQLAMLMKRPLYVVNLIPYNATGKFKPAKPEAIQKFRHILESAGVNVTERQTMGREINAACGQLAGKQKNS